MKNYSTFKKLSKGFISLLLVLAVMVSLFVPFNISVLAEEEPAKPGQMHAILYVVDTSKKNTDGTINYDDNLELVFQKGGAEDTNRTVLEHFEDFGGKDYENKQPPWRDEGPWNKLDSKNKRLGPSNVIKITVKDKIQPVSMCQWFESFRSVPTGNFVGIENIDTSECISMTQTFNYFNKITKLDLSMWDVSKVKSMICTFGRCWGLTELNISTWTFESATTMGMTFCGMNIEELDISSANLRKCTSFDRTFSYDGSYSRYQIKKIILPENFQVADKCNFSKMFYKQSELIDVNIGELKANNPQKMTEMFTDCKLLTDIDLSGITGTAEYTKNSDTNKNAVFNNMFSGCKALKTIDMSGYEGPIKFKDNNAPFKGCESLLSLDFAKINTASGSVTDLSDKSNLFADCPDFSWIRLSDKWPASDKIGSTMPIKGTWKKLDDPDKGLEKSNEELFRTFQSSYEGTWGAMAVITFKGNGGSPSFQTVNGIKNDIITFGPELTATRGGYDFAGWWPDKTAEPEGTSALQSGEEATQWSYYAHWTPHHYTLKLNGNGGTTEKNNETVTEYIATSSLAYDEFYELSNTFFTKEGSVLSSWNTRPNGTGTSFSANDSVDKLTEADGGEVTLYAQWHTPDVVVSFNTHGGTSVDDKYYTLETGQTVTYGDLSETTRSADSQGPGGYTFLGWYTEETGGTKITSSTEVTESCTLHAHWQRNSSVTFDANGGYFDNNTSKVSTTKICKPGRTLGVTPEPEHASATFEGWYTAASGGNEISSATTVDGDVIYYAHWGYKPKFVTNGGTFTSYNASLYQSQSDSNYTITALPTIDKEHSQFKGWYHNGTKLVINKENEDPNDDKVTLDLSVSNLIEAQWEDKTKYTINLNKNDGTNAKNTIKIFEGQTVGAFPIVTRSGYDFEGWFPNTDGTGTELKTTDTVSSSTSGDYYAKWSLRDRTLTFNADGGTMYDETTVKVANGKTIPALPGANRAGYYLDGWYTEKNGGGTKLTTDTVISENKTYYANWTPIKITDGIYKYSIAWTQNSNSNVTNAGNTLSFHPTIGDDMSANLYLLFEIDSKVDSEKQFPVGAVSITFPKSLFEENGVAKDKTNIDAFAPDKSKFDYTVSGDNYVFTNYVPLKAGDNIEFTFTCTVDPHNIKGGYTDQNGYYQGDYYQKNFTPSIVVTDATNPLNYSRAMNLEAHTKVITEAGKSRSNVVTSWNSDWGTRPADADEYFYVIWELESNGSSNSSQKYHCSWSEDTAHDGSVIYSDPELGTESNLMSSGKYYTTVVTKHLKSSALNELTTITNEAIYTVKWASGYTEHKRVFASTNVYIPSSSGSGSSIAKTVYDPSESFTPYKTEYHYRNGGQELILAEEEVVMPYQITYSESKNEYDLFWNNATEKYTAAKRDYVLTDGAKGDAVISTLTNSASYNWNNSANNALNDSDYYFTDLRLTVTECDAVCLGDVWSSPEEHTTYSDYDDIEVWIRTEGSDTFKIYKTLSGVSTATVDLPENTVGYQIKHSSEFYSTKINVKATFTSELLTEYFHSYATTSARARLR